MQLLYLLCNCISLVTERSKGRAVDSRGRRQARGGGRAAEARQQYEGLLASCEQQCELAKKPKAMHVTLQQCSSISHQRN